MASARHRHHPTAGSSREHSHWLYIPFILDAAGADLDTLFRPAPDGTPRERNLIRCGEALRVALDQADINLASITAEAGPLLHLTAQRQQEILRLCPPAAAFATREAWRLVGEVQWSLQDVHALVGPVSGEAVRWVVCQEDIAVGHPAMLPAYHPSNALHERCVRPMVIEYGSDAPRPLPFPLHPHPQAASPASHRALRLWRERAPPACQSSSMKPTRADRPRRLTGAPSAPYVGSLSARRSTSFPMSGSLTLMLGAWTYNAWG
jgi:hypothetical protein